MYLSEMLDFLNFHFLSSANNIYRLVGIASICVKVKTYIDGVYSLTPIQHSQIKRPFCKQNTFSGLPLSSRRGRHIFNHLKYLPLPGIERA